jgi:hypothetical protein
MKKEWIYLILPPAIAGLFGVFTASQFIEWMATASGLGTLIPIMVEFIKNRLNLSGLVWSIPLPFTKKKLITGKAARFITWGLAFMLVPVSHYLGYGFQSLSIWALIWNAFVVAFLANGYYKIAEVQLWLAKVTDNMDKIKAILEKLKNKEAK